MLSWSFTTLAVAAKHPMSSISDYVALKSAFTLLQFLIAGPLMALAHRSPGERRQKHDFRMSNLHYPQFCALARAAELIGERWTLLIIRELLLGPKRFGDLAGSPRWA